MGSIGPSPLPYWQTNIPPALRSETCPPYLLNQPAKNIRILSTHPSQHPDMSWAQLSDVIKRGALAELNRRPLDLYYYKKCAWELGKRWGGVAEYVVGGKLGWVEGVGGEKENVGRPFEREEDYRVLRNDFPYALERGIVHLVVWTKFVFEEDAETGELTEEIREVVEVWVGRMFRERCGTENVMWFVNPPALKSIKSVEHFHIMLRNPDPKFVEEVTGDDGSGVNERVTVEKLMGLKVYGE
ncbi:N-acetylglucosamine-induced 1 protein [Rutstroemia sp. NJR-2017a BBW]|nr:N-acetylglucosamine-induced 1 protein [Rutstroemia sp. NJR-2017a BBW]